MQHPEDRQQKLGRAGLSLTSDLSPEAIARADAIPLAKAMEMSMARLRQEIMRGTTANGKPKVERGPSVAATAIELLREQGPMHYRDLAEKLIASGVKTKGKTFAQTVAADLSRRATTGQVTRVAPGVYAAGGEDA